jgi:hypothetical protein
LKRGLAKQEGYLNVVFLFVVVFRNSDPLTVFASQTILSRKGRGNDHSKDNDKSFISFWIATGGQSRPRNDTTTATEKW